jgi:hypothetical protein
MSNIFIASAHEDLAYLDLVRQELEAKGYTLLYEGQSLALNTVLSSQTPELAIVSSTAMVLIWSAAQSGPVMQHILFAHQLKKLIIPIMLDSTMLPAGIDASLAIQTTCTGADMPTIMAHLCTHLPAPGSTDPLIQICQQITHPHISKRKDAINAAAVLLQRNEHRDELLALLAYIARKDMITSVRDKAQALLDAEHKGTNTLKNVNQSKDIFPVECPNKHTTYVNARRLCSQPEQVVFRSRPHTGKREREFLVSCSTQGCGEVMSIYIDCGGY